MYNKVHANSQVPWLEKDLEEARLKWVNLVKECATLIVRGEVGSDFGDRGGGANTDHNEAS